MTPPLTLNETMLIGILGTQILQDHESSGIGQFTLEVRVPTIEFLQSSDKPGLVKHMIAQHLAAAVYDTMVPQEKWFINIEPQFVAQMGLPESMVFGARA